MDLNHSKSILDQVDEYLHDNDTHSHQTYADHDKDGVATSALYSNNWLTDAIQLDLDHIGESFFNTNQSEQTLHHATTSNHSSNSSGSTRANNMHHQAGHLHKQGSDMGNTVHNDVFPAMGHDLKHDESISNTALGKNNHFSGVHSEMMFSPSASPLVGPGQNSLGLQVTPFMNPQVLMGSGPGSGSMCNINTPYMRDTTMQDPRQASGNVGTSAKATPHVSHYSPLSSPAVNDNQMYSSTNFALPDSAVKPITDENGNTSSSSSIKNGKTKRSSTSSRAKRISFSNSGGSSGKPSFSNGSSKVRKNSPYMSANRSRRQYQELKSKNGTSVSNNNSAGNTPNGNTSTTPNNASWDDMVFKLPESSSNISQSKESSGDGTPDDASKEPSLSASQFSIATKILPVSYGRPSANGIPGSVNGGTLQTSIETTESWKMKTNSGRTKSVNSYSGSSASPTNVKHEYIMNESPMMNARSSSKVEMNGLTRTKSRSSEGKSGKKDDSKKEVHKVAEQERRNRLNNALNDLCTLIPDELKATVSIPSKATTAELASVYIMQLQKRIHDLEQAQGFR